MTSDNRNGMSEKANAARRAIVGGSDGSSATNSAPMKGVKTISDNMGQTMRRLACGPSGSSAGEGEEQAHSAYQHQQRVALHIAGLDSAHDGSGRRYQRPNAVGRPVDNLGVDGLPEKPREADVWLDEQRVVELVNPVLVPEHFVQTAQPGVDAVDQARR